MAASMNIVCVLHFTVYVYVYVFTVFNKYVRVPLYSAMGIDNVQRLIRNKVCLFVL